MRTIVHRFTPDGEAPPAQFALSCGRHRGMLRPELCAEEGARTTMKDQPIDIMQEFIDLYGREDMLAFFDFSVDRPGKEAISGLCRISKPKGGSAKMQYLSLTFVADTPDENARTTIAEVLQRIDTDRVRRAVAEVSEVVFMPSMSSSAQNYVTQADLLLDAEPDRQFIVQRLLPAIRHIMQVKPTELVWWADELSGAGQRPQVQEQVGTSVVDGLRNYLAKHFRTAAV
jgi:hypothetical protein